MIGHKAGGSGDVSRDVEVRVRGTHAPPVVSGASRVQADRFEQCGGVITARGELLEGLHECTIRVGSKEGCIESAKAWRQL